VTILLQIVLTMVTTKKRCRKLTKFWKNKKICNVQR